MKYTKAINRMKALGPVTVDENGDATLDLIHYTLTVTCHASCDEVDAIFTWSKPLDHQRFHRSFRAAITFLGMRGE